MVHKVKIIGSDNRKEFESHLANFLAGVNAKSISYSANNTKHFALVVYDDKPEEKRRTDEIRAFG